MSWEEQEAAARRFHAQHANEAIKTWEEGFNLLHSNIAKLDGASLEDVPERRVMVAVLANAINSLKCIRDHALTGYFTQAMNLARLPIEDWMTYWYLRNYPGEHERFTDRRRKTPTFNGMLQKVEAASARRGVQVESNPAARWLRDFHDWSHTGGPTVRAVMAIDTERTSYHVGPQADTERCRAVFLDTLPQISMLLGAANNLLMLMGVAAIVELDAYEERAVRLVRAGGAAG